jgi:hypothetical protein
VKLGSSDEAAAVGDLIQEEGRPLYLEQANEVGQALGQLLASKLVLYLAMEQLLGKVWLQRQQEQVLQRVAAFHQMERCDEVQPLAPELHCWWGHIRNA